MGVKLCLSHRVLRGIFGPKREEVLGDWRRLHNEELLNLYAPRNIIKVIKTRRMRWVGHVARMGEMRNAYKILVGKHEGTRLHERPRRRWPYAFLTEHRAMKAYWGSGGVAPRILDLGTRWM
jgi:hypothetical protein